MAKEGIGFKVNSVLVFVAGRILVDEVSQGLLPSQGSWGIFRELEDLILHCCLQACMGDVWLGTGLMLPY